MNPQFADLNGARIRYEVQGQGQPLVLIHAGIANLTMWDDQVDVFTEFFQVIRYDIRGWGESMEPPGPYSDYEDLRALLDHLQVDRAAIVGVSFGGGIAIDFALAYPDRVSALVLVGSALNGYDATEDDWSGELLQKDKALDEAYEQGDKARAAELGVQIWVDGLYRQPTEVDPDFRARALALMLHTFELPDGEGERQPLEPPSVCRLQEMNQPTLVVIGELDVPEMFSVVDMLQNEISNARKVIMVGATHLPNMEKPAEFNRIVLDFLSTG